MKEKLLNIAIPGAPAKLFTYRDKSAEERILSPGQRCLVPFGRRKSVGYYIAPAPARPEIDLKSVIAWLEPYSLYTPEMFLFLNWMAEYYLTGIADVLQAALPPEMRKIRKPFYLISDNFATAEKGSELPRQIMKKILARGLITSRQSEKLEKEIPGLLEKLVADGLVKVGYTSPASNIDQIDFSKIFPYIKERNEISGIIPNQEQTAAIDEIRAKIDCYAPFLLFGITGSGKTLVYCRVAREIVGRGKTVLVLVPEIALAGTLLAYFKAFFGEEVALLHSAFRPRERLLIWQEIKNGRFKVVIGARSAIFAPLENLGIIIVDEEHDESYKQDDRTPRFQARDAAVMRAKIYNIPVILGSASPSVESFYNAQAGRYDLLRLTRRPQNVELPLIRLVDLKEERVGGEVPLFTKTLLSRTKDSLEANQQVIFYLNRRGFSPRIKCTECGHTPLCPNCELHLTFHRAGGKLMCHFCGYTNVDYDKCSVCGGTSFVYIGSGTQKIEDKIGEVIPEAHIVRLDSDSAAGRERSHIILGDFAEGKFNLLLGTQMVTKGIDFPRVSLVGVLLADIGMDMPDFRATEKLFAKLIQVSGRSGRGVVPGEVIIQTYNPESALIDDAARQDYETFYAREIRSRKNLKYPPFVHLINFRLSSKKEEELHKYALELKARISKGAKKANLSIDLLGPAPCPLYRLRGMYRRHFFIKTARIRSLVKYIRAWEEAESNFGLPSKIRLTIDIDPYDMM